VSEWDAFFAPLVEVGTNGEGPRDHVQILAVTLAVTLRRMM
jgi:hypothetical protein